MNNQLSSKKFDHIKNIGEAMIKVIVFILAALLFVMSCRQKTENTMPVTAPKIEIKTAAVKRMNMADTVRFYGKITLRNELLLASQFDGRLAGFNLFLGDRVRRGQKIAEIIPAEREALLQVLPKIDARLRPVLREQIKTIPLTSPIDGTILKVLRHSGDVLQKGQPIVHIGNLNVLDVIGELPVSALSLARKLKTIGVSFINYPHPALALPVAAIGGRVDHKKQTVVVRLTLNNPNREFRPGMLVKMYFQGKIHQNTLVIPRSALLEQEGHYSVFVVTGNKVKKRPLKVGIKRDRMIEVISGLKESEQVATKNAYSLMDGMEVVAQ